MIISTRALQVYAYRKPVDMRKGLDALYGLVLEELGRDPLTGDIFVFISRNRKRAKALLWDGTGLCLYSKRLERGRFAQLWGKGESYELKMTLTELQLLLEGSHAVGKYELSPAIFDTRSVALLR